MIKVRRLANVSFETADLSRQSEYYQHILGLTETGREDGLSYLSSVNDHHSVILRQGAAPRCTRISFQVGPNDDLGQIAKDLESQGVAAAMKSDAEPGTPSMVTFLDPKGTEIALFNTHDLASHDYKQRGVVPQKLGHIAFNAPDARKIAKFYCDVLGFKLSDQIEDYFIFLRCGPDHHTVNFVETPKAKMHHVAFELRDVEHLIHACDFLGHNGYDIIWGPGRHVRGHNIFTYHRDPDGQIIELFTQLDQMNDDEIGIYEPRPWHASKPHRPSRWPKNRRDTNLWGTMPPDGFMD